MSRSSCGDPNIIQENSGNNSLDRNNTYSFQYSDGEGAFVKPQDQPMALLQIHILHLDLVVVQKDFV